jgi:hypothetical protein
MTAGGPIVGSAEYYQQFVALVRARLAALQIPMATVDALAGFPQNYTSKLLSNVKTCSVHSFFVLSKILCLSVQFCHDADELARFEQHSQWIKVRRGGDHFRGNIRRKEGARKNTCAHDRDFLIMRARKGGMAAARNMTRKQRRERARKAIMARWHPAPPGAL